MFNAFPSPPCTFITHTVSQVFPCLQQLVMDPSDHVRQALASVMNDMSPVLGRENTINHLLPMLLTLLRDTNPEVRCRNNKEVV